MKKIKKGDVLSRDEDILYKFDVDCDVIITNVNNKKETDDKLNFEIDLDKSNIIRCINRESPIGNNNLKKYTRLDEDYAEYICFISEDIYCEDCNITNQEYICIYTSGCFLTGQIRKTNHGYLDSYLVSYISG
jgi:hypothetical protein